MLTKLLISLLTFLLITSCQEKVFPKHSTEIGKSGSVSAENDIAQGRIKLYCAVGFAPKSNNANDKEFESQFQVKYIIVGDALPTSLEQIKLYNKKIAEHLDRQHGTAWRDKARKDIPGIEL